MIYYIISIVLSIEAFCFENFIFQNNTFDSDFLVEISRYLIKDMSHLILS